MKKAFYIIGMFLLVQCGMGIVLKMLTHLIKAGARAVGASSPVSMPTLELAILIITNILVIVFAVLICRKGWKAPFRWRKPYSDSSFPDSYSSIPVLPDETDNLQNVNRDFPQQTTTFPTGKTSFARSPYFSLRRNLILLSLIGMLPLMFAVNALNEWIDLPDLMSETFYAMSFSPLALAALAVAGPIAEEFCFRYGLEGSLLEDRRESDGGRKFPVWAAVVVSAAVFGLIHVNPAQIVGAFLFGLYFGALYAFTGSLWPSMLCHVLNNLAAVVMMRVLPEDFTLTASLNDNALLLMLVLLSLIILFLILRAMIIVHRRAVARFSSARGAEE